MSWFRADSRVKPNYTSLQIQTATSTLPIPIGWGQFKISPNVIWTNGFASKGGSNSSGKGGLFGGSGNVEYFADIIMGVCEGVVTEIQNVWVDQSVTTLSLLGLGIANGWQTQAAWSYLATNYPNQTLEYSSTCYTFAAHYPLDSSGNLGNHNFECFGTYQSTGANGADADPAQVIYDFLTNAQYGAGFAPGSINSSTLISGSGGGDATLQSYCHAMGICISPVLTTQEPASSILARWLQIVNCAAVWSQSELKFIPYGDQTIGSGNVTQSVLTSVPIPPATTTGGSFWPTIQVCTPAQWVSDGGVVYTFTGEALTYETHGPTAAGQYAISPNGSYLFYDADEGAAITITFTTSNSWSYVPNLTPAYSLTDQDFLLDGNEDPVKVSRVDPFSLPTILRLDVLSRNNQYSATIVEARDQAQVEAYGVRVASTVTAHEICDDVTVAPVVAQTLLQRQLYVRAHYAFKLGLEYCLLDPMDIVELTDANLGLSATPVRIVSIEEDDNGDLTIEAEELVFGVSTPALNPSRGVNGYQPNRAVAACPVNATPLIYEPPPALTNSTNQLWLGASGGTGAEADPNWGGAYVWISLDNVTYTQYGQIDAPMRQGALTASLASATGWDATHTLAVNLTESAGVLTGTSMASAGAGATLCLVDSELLAYETATLTSGFDYNVTGLARALYGTTGAAHSSGAAFYRLDSAVLQSSLSTQYVGRTLYFKFQSYNVSGGGVQDLSACAVYAYTPSGGGVPSSTPLAAALAAGTNENLGTASTASAWETWGGALDAVTIGASLGGAT